MRQLGIQGRCYCILEYEVVFIVTFNYVRQADLASMVTTGGMVMKLGNGRFAEFRMME